MDAMTAGFFGFIGKAGGIPCRFTESKAFPGRLPVSTGTPAPPISDVRYKGRRAVTTANPSRSVPFSRAIHRYPA